MDDFDSEEHYESYSDYKAKKKKKINKRGYVLLTLVCALLALVCAYLAYLLFFDNGPKPQTKANDKPAPSRMVGGQLPKEDAKAPAGVKEQKPASNKDAVKAAQAAQDNGKVNGGKTSASTASDGANTAKANNENTSPSTIKDTGKYAALYGNAKYLIHIHKQSYLLELFEKGKNAPIRTYSIAVARNSGDKQRTGDNRTPTSWGNVVGIPQHYQGAKIGVASSAAPFRVEEICDASSWSHDFKDGKGVIPHAYGPWFISLDTGWDGIGIHGTHDPNSIGTKASEGCIRMHNKDVAEVKTIICSYNGGIGTRVVITED